MTLAPQVDTRPRGRALDGRRACASVGAAWASPRPILPSARCSCAMAWLSGAASPRLAGGRTPRRARSPRLAKRRAGATLYVTLEPCAHHGATPPCAGAIVAAGIARVVCAIGDPDPRVAGEGFAILRAAGIEVDVGPGAEAARRDHRGHILRVVEGRPMVTLKLARTADGYAAGDEHDPRLAITGEAANLRVQVMRSLHDAIMIGVGTALGDDPLLTVRLLGVQLRPLRVVLDSRLSPAAALAACARRRASSRPWRSPADRLLQTARRRSLQPASRSSGSTRTHPARIDLCRGAAAAWRGAASRASSAKAARASARGWSQPVLPTRSCCSPL